MDTKEIRIFGTFGTERRFAIQKYGDTFRIQYIDKKGKLDGGQWIQSTEISEIEDMYKFQEALEKQLKKERDAVYPVNYKQKLRRGKHGN